MPNRNSHLDLSGQRFARLVATEFLGWDAETSPRFPIWRCTCDCGQQVIVRAGNLRSGHTRSCGCARLDAAARTATLNRRHGHTKSATYRSWIAMRQRCSARRLGNESYFARGISVCDRWLVFENFLADMGERPSRRHSIDRINNNGNYEPGNCRWATASQQQRNTSRTRLTDAAVAEIRSRRVRGEQIRALAREFCVHPTTISHLLSRKNWA